MVTPTSRDRPAIFFLGLVFLPSDGLVFGPKLGTTDAQKQSALNSSADGLNVTGGMSPAECH